MVEDERLDVQISSSFFLFEALQAYRTPRTLGESADEI
jgi:hypothetical protein